MRTAAGRASAPAECLAPPCTRSSLAGVSAPPARPTLALSGPAILRSPGRRAAMLPPMLDRLHRLALRAAYLLMRVFWAVARPVTHGVLVAVWQGGEVLLVRNSYQPLLSLPGGYRRRGEDPVAAAVRELREELGLAVASADLRPGFTMQHRWMGKHEHVVVLELRPAARPATAIDRREIVEARWVTPAEALQLPLLPPVRRAVEAGAGPAGRG